MCFPQAWLNALENSEGLWYQSLSEDTFGLNFTWLILARIFEDCNLFLSMCTCTFIVPTIPCYDTVLYCHAVYERCHKRIVYKMFKWYSQLLCKTVDVALLLCHIHVCNNLLSTLLLFCRNGLMLFRILRIMLL